MENFGYMVFFLTPTIQCFLTQNHILTGLMAVFVHFFYQIHSRLMAKSQLIIGQKFERMVDNGAFWEIWLHIVLNISLFEAFRASFRVKITLDYRPKKSK